MQIRYIRDWQNGRTINGAQGTNCDWRQIMAIDYFGRNIAKGKANGEELPGDFWVGEGAMWYFLTDEDFNTNLWTNDRPNERKSVTIDLMDIYDIDKLVIARAKNPAACKETKTEVSIDGVKWITVFDSSIEGTYEEQQNGREFKLQDDRFNIPNEDSSLGEVISFFDDYSEFNKVQKSVLKTNLIGKGVEVKDSDKLSTLIGKVGNIKLGKKWASGTSVSNSVYKDMIGMSGSSANRAYPLLVVGLDFKASHIYIYPNSGNTSMFDITIATTNNKLNSTVNGYVYYTAFYPNISNNTYDFYIGKDGSDYYVTSNSFSVPVYRGNTSYTWIAYE